MEKRHVARRIRHILWYSDLEATRFALAWGSFFWAIFLFWPGDLFTPARQTYALMAKIAPEHIWGVLFLLQGMVMTYSLLWGYRSQILFVADALLGCVLWTVSTLACFLAHYTSITTYQPPAAMSYELVGAFASWWCLVRYTVEKKKKVL